MVFYTVYKTTNIITGRYYIGAHKTNDPDDSYLGSGDLISRAIEKHGRTNFKKEILFIAFTIDDMLCVEELFVNEDVVNDPHSYNLSIGGKGWSGDNFWTYERRIERSFYYKGENNPNFAKKHGNDTIRKMRGPRPSMKGENHPLYGIKRTNFSGSNHPRYGIKHSEEAKNKMRGRRKSMDGKNNPNFGFKSTERMNRICKWCEETLENVTVGELAVHAKKCKSLNQTPL